MQRTHPRADASGASHGDCVVMQRPEPISREHSCAGLDSQKRLQIKGHSVTRTDSDKGDHPSFVCTPSPLGYQFVDNGLLPFASGNIVSMLRRRKQ